MGEQSRCRVQIATRRHAMDKTALLLPAMAAAPPMLSLYPGGDSDPYNGGELPYPGGGLS
uniref:Uncharacterized protein n=1 Tax=Leersia perrieri TaxID=77586 RepID=A0A0D9WK91_9ORYZ